MLLTGMLLLAGSGISCSDSGEDTDPVKNKLRVEPSEVLHFKALANEDVVLTVTTDADSWGCTAPEWVLTEQEGNRLSVNVRDNASGEVRTGELEFTAGNAEPVTIGITQAIPEEEDDNVLEVSPMDPIAFKASGNGAVVLTVSTDAEEGWTFTVPEWLTAEKSEDNKTLTVNAEDNETEEERSGEIVFSAGTAEPVKIAVSQKKATLEVTPSDPIVFKASDNEAVVLTVSTDAKESWTFTVPEWLTAEKSEDNKTLTVNAKDNETEEERSGEIVFSAGIAEPVKITVKQEKPAPDRPDVHMMSMSGMNLVEQTDVDRSQTYQAGVSVYLDQAPETEYTARVFVDESYLDAFNSEHSKNCKLFPAELVKFDFAADGTLKFTPDIYQYWNQMITIDVTSSSLEAGVPYLIPFYIESESDEFDITEACRVNYVLTLKEKEEIPGPDPGSKSVRNLLIIETNDVNPLNALSFKFTNDQPFFDAVVLFSANIRYDSEEDYVYLYTNSSITDCLANNSLALQPLRRAGIKVYLGLLGDHTPAGIGNLTDAGAQAYAKEVAQAIKQYNIDGVFLDDEYTQGAYDGTWFSKYASDKKAARLAYELKKAMKEVGTENSDVVAYKLGALNYLGENCSFDGQVPADYIDVMVPDYGMDSWPDPYYSMDKKNTGAVSINFIYSNNQNTVTEENARRTLDEGYGWWMWYNLNPASNFDAMYEYAKTMSTVWYEGAEVAKPDVYYSKGNYNPKPYTSR